MKVWQNEERPKRAGLATGRTSVTLDGYPEASIKSNKITRIGAMPVKVPFVRTIVTSSYRDAKNISRFCIIDYTVDEIGYNYHGDN